MSDSDHPIRYHTGSHYHSVDRDAGIWRQHSHRHPHGALEAALHDRPNGGGRDAGHAHEHLPSHPYGQLLKIKEFMDRPESVEVLDPLGKAADYRQLALDTAASSSDLSRGYLELADQMDKLASPDRSS
jgi:hypothetical protein